MRIPRPRPRVTTVWCPIPDDDTGYSIRGSYTGYGDDVEVSSPEIEIDGRWVGVDGILHEILCKVLQPAADQAAEKDHREFLEAMQMQADERDDRWHDERKERQMERARRMAAE